MTSRWKLRCLGGALMLAGAHASAQESMVIEEIVVTAQKRAENIQDVPISMSVVSGSDLDDFQRPDLQGIMNQVPNLYVQRLNAADVVYIRGFGSAPANFAFDQSVSLYQDGVYGGRAKQFEAPFFDLERIEVMRGPQGALFGKNTPAGAISIVTRGATDYWDAGIRASYNFDLHGTDISGHVSGPLSDTLSARLAVKSTDLKGWVYNVNSTYDDPRHEARLARATLDFHPSDTVSIVGKFEYSDKEVRGANIVLAPIETGSPITSVRYSDPNPFGMKEANEVTSRNASVTANVDVGEHTLTSITAYSSFEDWRANVYSTDIPARYSNSFPEDFEQISQEIRLLSPVGRKFEYIVGAYYDTSDYDLDYLREFDFPELDLGGRTRSVFTQDASSYSIFGQGTLNVSEAVRVIGSLRWTQTDKKGRFDTSVDFGDPFGAITSARGKISEDYTDPSITVQYDLSDDVMLYAVWAKGSKSGGFVSNTGGTTDETFEFEAETSTNYEAGLKSTLMNDRLVLNVSIYDTQFEDLQRSIYDPEIIGFITKNAAEASSTGVEIMTIWRAAPGLTFTASGAYQDAKYDDYPGAACLASQPASCVAETNNIAGTQLTYASDWTGNLQVDYSRPVLDGLELRSKLIAAYRSKYFNADNHSPVYGVQSGYVKYDARLELADMGDRWSVALVGKNLTDKKTYNFSFAIGYPVTVDPRVHMFLEEPRTIALEASLRL